jgi:hypothetical protein
MSASPWNICHPAERCLDGPPIGRGLFTPIGIYEARRTGVECSALTGACAVRGGREARRSEHMLKSDGAQMA